MCWTCTACNTYATKFNKSIHELDCRLNQAENGIEENTQSKKTMKDNMTDIQDKVENLSKKRSEPGADVRSVFSELNERNSRKLNIIIHGISKSELTSKEERETLVSN